MKKIAIVLAILLLAKESYAQEIDYSFDPDTLNSDQYLKRQGLLERADVYRALFLYYKNNAGIEDSVVMMFTNFDMYPSLDGVYAVYGADYYTIYVTLDRLKSDTSIVFVHGLNIELFKIKNKILDKILTDAEKIILGDKMFIFLMNNMGTKQYAEYLKFILSQNKLFEDPDNTYPADK